MLWSWILATIGVAGLFLTTRKLAAGFAIGMGVQVLWVAYAVVTDQYGFIFSASAFFAVNAWGLWQWTRPAKTTEKIKTLEEKEQELTVKIQEVQKLKQQIQMTRLSDNALRSTMLLNEESSRREKLGDFAETANPLAYFERKPPSEYTVSGDPIWNVYPFVRRYGTQIVLGPNSSKKYVLSKNEAYHAGRALMEASGYPEKE